jgi:hypothetical protein
MCWKLPIARTPMRTSPRILVRLPGLPLPYAYPRFPVKTFLAQPGPFFVLTWQSGVVICDRRIHMWLRWHHSLWDTGRWPVRNRDLARYLARHVLFPLVIFTAVGCQSMHPTVPVAVTIRDAETKAPIPNADVVFLYPTDDSSSHSRDSTGKTNPSGIAQIRAVTGDDALPQVKVSALGYLTEQKGLPGEALRAIKAADPFLSFASHQNPVEVAVEVYHGPLPTVELIVANGYRGIVKIEVRIREDVVYEPGQRVFSRNVPSDGSVQVDGPPILRYDRGPVYCARYADSNNMISTQDLKDDEVGFRWLRCEVRTEFFVIGTRGEWESYRRSAPKSSGSDSGGGKGGGGRRGGGGGS